MIIMISSRSRIRIRNPASIDQGINYLRYLTFRTLRLALFSGSKLCQLAFAGFFVFGRDCLLNSQTKDQILRMTDLCLGSVLSYLMGFEIITQIEVYV